VTLLALWPSHPRD